MMVRCPTQKLVSILVQTNAQIRVYTALYILYYSSGGVLGDILPDKLLRISYWDKIMNFGIILYTQCIVDLHHNTWR